MGVCIGLKVIFQYLIIMKVQALKKDFPDSNEKENDCDTAGILGMLPSIIGNIQALEAIKIIVGIDNNLSGKLLIYNILTHQITKLSYDKNQYKMLFPC